MIIKLVAMLDQSIRVINYVYTMWAKSLQAHTQLELLFMHLDICISRLG